MSSLIGNHIQKFDTLDSTNNYIAKYCESEKMAEGTVILALEQTEGKGRFFKKWHSDTGQNLTFSFLLRPKNLKASTPLILTKWVCSAICLYLENTGFKPVIKLPNDIFLNGKKVCGILIENKLQNDLITRSIVGVGLNLNQVVFDSDFQHEATSLFKEDGSKRDIDQELNLLLSYLSYCFSRSLSDLEFTEFTFLKFLGRSCYRLTGDEREKINILSVQNEGVVTYQNEIEEIKSCALDDLKLQL
ncbi:MAG: biotin--[acetyl-CoA-carboxylase] ligase [Flavobacteriales bacterium]|nr:biotin--[acetyl-CoA-carboxylase] ligase [Flavobacteriales bacterium]